MLGLCCGNSHLQQMHAPAILSDGPMCLSTAVEVECPAFRYQAIDYMLHTIIFKGSSGLTKVDTRSLLGGRGPHSVRPLGLQPLLM
jgi:hypothetical protein